jgi:hypothetical protein
MGKRLRSPSQEHGTEQQKNLKKLYFCTCERYCHGGKEVSKRTLASHANYRDKQDYSSVASSVSENSSESDSDTSGSSESGSHSYESDSNNSETRIPPNKKARLREPDSFAFEDAGSYPAAVPRFTIPVAVVGLNTEILTDRKFRTMLCVMLL